MFPSNRQATENRPVKKLRSTCDLCHQGKIKCSGGNPCTACERSDVRCHYSVSNRIGRPKGVKNKKTLEIVGRQNEVTQAANQQRGEASTSGGSQRFEDSATQPSISSDSGRSKGGTPIDNISFEALVGQASDGFNFLADSDNFWSLSEPLASGFDPMELSETHPTREHSVALNQVTQSWSSSSLQPVGTATIGEVSVQLQETTRNPLALNILDSQNHGSNELDRYNAITRPATMSVVAPPSCNCLRHHVDLFCKLKALKQNQSARQIDMVLVDAQQALDLWKELLQCRVCQQSYDQETLLLWMMGVRALLRRIRSLCLASDDDDQDDDTLTGSEHSSSGLQRPVSRRSDSIRSTVGIYEIKGEEGTLVTNLLILQTLRKISMVLSRLKTRFEEGVRNRKADRTTVPRSRRGAVLLSAETHADQDLPQYDIEHLQQLVRSLDDIVQALVAKLKNTYSLAVHAFTDDLGGLT